MPALGAQCPQFLCPFPCPLLTWSPALGVRDGANWTGHRCPRSREEDAGRRPPALPGSGGLVPGRPAWTPGHPWPCVLRLLLATFTLDAGPCRPLWRQRGTGDISGTKLPQSMTTGHRWSQACSCHGGSRSLWDPWATSRPGLATCPGVLCHLLASSSQLSASAPSGVKGCYCVCGHHAVAAGSHRGSGALGSASAPALSAEPFPPALHTPPP